MDIKDYKEIKIMIKEEAKIYLENILKKYTVKLIIKKIGVSSHTWYKKIVPFYELDVQTIKNNSSKNKPFFIENSNYTVSNNSMENKSVISNNIMAKEDFRDKILNDLKHRKSLNKILDTNKLIVKEINDNEIIGKINKEIKNKDNYSILLNSLNAKFKGKNIIDWIHNICLAIEDEKIYNFNLLILEDNTNVNKAIYIGGEASGIELQNNISNLKLEEDKVFFIRYVIEEKSNDDI